MGRPPRTDWKKRATEARKKLRTAKHGNRDEELRSNAASGQNANTLRREIFALNFLDEFKKSNPSIYPPVSKLPFSIVELLARWSVFDVERANLAAAEAAQEGYTVERLTEALSVARKHSKSGQTHSSIRDAIGETVLQTVRPLFRGDIWKVEPNPSVRPADAAVDFRFDHQERADWSAGPQTIAVILVGPYQDARLYKHRQRDWLLKSFACSLFYDHVVLLLTAHEPIAAYRAAMERLEESIPAGAGRPRSIRVSYAHIEQTASITDDEAELLKGPQKPPLP